MEPPGPTARQPRASEAQEPKGSEPQTTDADGSPVLRAASVGLALGMLFALGVVIGSRSPNAIESYDFGSAVLVVLKLGAVLGVLAGAAGVFVTAVRKLLRHRRASAAPVVG